MMLIHFDMIYLLYIVKRHLALFELMEKKLVLYRRSNNPVDSSRLSKVIVVFAWGSVTENRPVCNQGNGAPLAGKGE